MPDDYALFKAAKELGVPPWELARQPTYWRDRTLFFMRAEAEARAARRKMDEADARLRGGR